MKYAFLSIVIFVIGCSNPETPSKGKNEEIPDPSSVMMFEGEQYFKVDLDTYQRETDEYQTILTLFPNGKVKSVEHQGEFQSCGALVDTSRYFNEDGALIKQVYHDHWMPEGATGCHESIHDQHITEYFDKGSIKAKKVLRMAYEDEEHKAGTWQEFDENGKVISTINYGDPYAAEEVLKIEFIEKLEANFGEPYNRSILSSKGFIRVKEAEGESGDVEFCNTKDNSKIVLSKGSYHGESVFLVQYSVNRNQLLAFEEALRQTKGIYRYDESSKDTYLKKGLGTYESKQVKLNNGEIYYSHVIGKELGPFPPNFDERPIEIRPIEN